MEPFPRYAIKTAASVYVSPVTEGRDATNASRATGDTQTANPADAVNPVARLASALLRANALVYQISLAELVTSVVLATTSTLNA